MNKQQHERVLAKDDSDLFQLVRQLTSEPPPQELWNSSREAEPVIPVELPLSALLQAVDRLPMDQVRFLHHRLGDRLTRATATSV